LFRPSAPALDKVLDQFEPPKEGDLKEYSGRHYVCDYGTPAMHCDDPWCWSQLCWIKNNLCLIYLDGGTYFRGVTLYPFHTHVDEEGMERVRAARIPRYLREPG
ncbi:MAG TPA: hypothetical protein VFX38_03815, partial [Gammaproteobacteria bacterium]|nr:hypothetical protein [Gammaproteobacteria bacterium]